MSALPGASRMGVSICRLGDTVGRHSTHPHEGVIVVLSGWDRLPARRPDQTLALPCPSLAWKLRNSQHCPLKDSKRDHLGTCETIS